MVHGWMVLDNKTNSNKIKSLRHSLGKPSHSDFVQFQFDKATNKNFKENMR